MSALAEMLIAAGATVTGCDTAVRARSATRLRVLGAEIHEGQDPIARRVRHSSGDHDSRGARRIIRNSMAARAAGIPVLKRAQALGAFVNQGTVVAIAGTHGKTTTTAMTTAVLAEARLQPTGFVGGTSQAGTAVCICGGDELFVVEADEYDRSFLDADAGQSRW